MNFQTPVLPPPEIDAITRMRALTDWAAECGDIIRLRAFGLILYPVTTEIACTFARHLVVAAGIDVDSDEYCHQQGGPDMDRFDAMRLIEHLNPGQVLRILGGLECAAELAGASESTIARAHLFGLEHSHTPELRAYEDGHDDPKVIEIVASYQRLTDREVNAAIERRETEIVNEFQKVGLRK